MIIYNICIMETGSKPGFYTSCPACARVLEGNWRLVEGLLSQRRELIPGIVQVDGEEELRIGKTMEGV